MHVNYKIKYISYIFNYAFNFLSFLVFLSTVFFDIGIV